MENYLFLMIIKINYLSLKLTWIYYNGFLILNYLKLMGGIT